MWTEYVDDTDLAGWVKANAVDIGALIESGDLPCPAKCENGWIHDHEHRHSNTSACQVCNPDGDPNALEPEQTRAADPNYPL